jgi:precorrin-6A/cobalt-precorrin-6A reductase
MSVVLVLGGTAEARAVASALVAAGVPVVSSLAGRVANPQLPVGEVRIGGFGGPEGLAAWLAENRVTAVVDATHPFAKHIGTSAVTGARMAGVPLLRLQRPGWQPESGDRWHWAGSLEQAAAELPALGERVFLTSGRQGLSAFASLDDLWFLIRCVDPPEPPLPAKFEVLLDRGPYLFEAGTELMRFHRIEVLVTKDSGGTMTSAKLAAARELRLPVVVIRRPRRPDAETVDGLEAAVEWALRR